MTTTAGNFFSEICRASYQNQVNALFRASIRVVTVGLATLSGSIGLSLVDRNGDAMIAEEVKPPDSESSAKNEEETQPKDSPQEDPDTARGEAFKRMFPDVPGKPSGRAKKPSE